MIPTASASEKHQAPSKIWPIALTLCVGKTLHDHPEESVDDFMSTNGYLHASVQQAFLSGTPGCPKLQQKWIPGYFQCS